MLRLPPRTRFALAQPGPADRPPATPVAIAAAGGFTELRLMPCVPSRPRRPDGAICALRVTGHISSAEADGVGVWRAAHLGLISARLGHRWRR